MTTASTATLILVGLFIVLVFLRVPVVYSIGIASLVDFFYLGINPMQMALKFVSNLNSYTLLAVPFYITMAIALLILTYFPQSFMWLPELMY